MRLWRGRPKGDGGSFPLEAAILTPVIIAFLCLVIAFGRTTLAGNAVDAAAKEGAREASIARDPGDAQALAEGAAARSLRQDGLGCKSLQVVARYDRKEIGEVGSVVVTVNCTVSLSDIAFPGMPGSKTMTGKFTSVVDRYRERG
ncbi:TadE/TadG family type IV pilus assembly protein [Embleya sp. NBC_00896]|uniref:TadE/TadG family type IV pilus assembly protein n=1 Tax=Embleya sp. NBC_00896 TaxID=2975961 RepID=UPI00386B692A|nr:pilus assembly protein [Embleya sp. NBC_00896]